LYGDLFLITPIQNGITPMGVKIVGGSSLDLLIIKKQIIINNFFDIKKFLTFVLEKVSRRNLLKIFEIFAY